MAFEQRRGALVPNSFLVQKKRIRVTQKKGLSGQQDFSLKTYLAREAAVSSAALGCNKLALRSAPCGYQAGLAAAAASACLLLLLLLLLMLLWPQQLLGLQMWVLLLLVPLLLSLVCTSTSHSG